MNSDYYRLNQAYLGKKEAFEMPFSEEAFNMLYTYTQFINPNNTVSDSMKPIFIKLLSILFSPTSVPGDNTLKLYSAIPSFSLPATPVSTFIFNFTDDEKIIDNNFELFLGPFKFKNVPNASYSLTTSEKSGHHTSGSIGKNFSFNYKLSVLVGKNETAVFVILNTRNRDLKQSEKIGLFNLHETITQKNAEKKDATTTSTALRAKFLISFSRPIIQVKKT